MDQTDQDIASYMCLLDACMFKWNRCVWGSCETYVIQPGWFYSVSYSDGGIRAHIYGPAADDGRRCFIIPFGFMCVLRGNDL